MTADLMANLDQLGVGRIDYIVCTMPSRTLGLDPGGARPISGVKGGDERKCRDL